MIGVGAEVVSPLTLLGKGTDTAVGCEIGTLLDGIKVIVGGIVMRVGLMEMLGRRLG